MTEECDNCARLQEEHRAQIEVMAQENRDLAELANTRDGIALKATRAEAKLRAELAKAREEDPESTDIRAVFNLWKELYFPGNKLVRMQKVDGPRGKAIKAAIRHSGKQACDQAVRGAQFDSYRMEHRHLLTIERVLKDEETIQKLQALYQTNRPLQAVPDEVAGPSDLPDIHTQMRWSNRLREREDLHERLREVMGWDPRWFNAFNMGWDDQARKLAFTVYDSALDGAPCVNVLRWIPGGKVEAVPGRPLRLWPSLRDIDGNPALWLVASPDAAVSGRQLGVVAVCCPFDSEDVTWREPLAGMRLVVCLGTHHRKAADVLAHALIGVASEVRVVDLDPKREDVYDVSGWLKAGNSGRALQELGAAATPLASLKDRRAA